MESKTKIVGHPIHPMLIVFPLGLFSSSLIFDMAYLATKKKELATVSYWMLVSGLVGGMVAAPFGSNDWLHIPDGTRAKSVGMIHGLGNFAVIGLFGASWLLRRGKPTQPGAAAIAVALLAGGLSLSTAWLGGEMSYRLGVGVDRGAHLDSPSSLSGEPASHNAAEGEII